MQSKESETRKQIEIELKLQDALKEIFEPDNPNPCVDVYHNLYPPPPSQSGHENPCGEIPLGEPKPTDIDSNKPLLNKYGVDNKKELFKKLYARDNETWDDTVKRISESVNDVDPKTKFVEMDFHELEIRVMAVFLHILQKIADANKHENDDDL